MSGKTYNGEKAIISLTSWKARIGTVSKTIFSLIKMCPGFHIVLVLSEEEFPKKEGELPENLMLFVKNNLIEILWVYKNYKSFKKVLFTMDKYGDVPVISADDDCVYLKNYAKELYDVWSVHKNNIIANSKSLGSGWGILFFPSCFSEPFKHLKDNIIKTNHDDFFYKFLMKQNDRKCLCLYTRNKCKEFVKFHDDEQSITNLYNPYEAKTKKVFKAEFGFEVSDEDVMI